MYQCSTAFVLNLWAQQDWVCILLCVDQAFLIPQIPSGCTVPKPFPLATGRRIEERHRYDEELQRRQDAAEERDRELEEEREREEKQKLKEYRKTLVIKVGYGISCGHHPVGGGGGRF